MATCLWSTGAWADAPVYAGSTFNEIWGETTSDPYVLRPDYEVTIGGFYDGLKNKMVQDAERTLADQNDLIPQQQKRIHPNGICLSGTWNVTESNSFTGLFRRGTEARVILRASTGLTNTKQKSYRAFSIAGKVFPTLDDDQRVRTANFFSVENLGGTLRKYFLDSENTNDILAGLTITPSALLNSALGGLIVNALKRAENTLLISQVSIRQLYPLSEIGERSSDVRTPVWIMVTGDPTVPRVDREDFRDELAIENYPTGLFFSIYVADQGLRLGPKNWQYVGHIEVDDSVVSLTCDQRLHFAHPPFDRSKR